MAKWRLVFKALPAVALVLIARQVVERTDTIKGALSFADTGAVLTGAALIMGLMLAGVIGDYREAEKLVPAVGGLFLAFESYVTRAMQVIGADASDVHRRIGVFAHAVDEWFYGRIDTPTMWAAYGELNSLADDCARMNVHDSYEREIHSANNNLGGAIDRIDIIRRTSYIKSGYALLEVLVAIVLVLMSVCSFENTAASYVVPSAISMTYTFMILLIKDLDNPFGWAENGGKGSAADVDSSYWVNAYKTYQ